MVGAFIVIAIVILVFLVISAISSRGGSSAGATISAFSASPMRLCAGSAITLNWASSGGTSASLSFSGAPGQTVREALGSVPVTGTKTVHVDGAGMANFTLTVNSASRTAPVELIGASGTTATLSPIGTIRCGVPDSVNAWVVAGGTATRRSFSGAMWEGTLTLGPADFGANLVVRSLQLGPASGSRQIFVRHNGFEIELQTPGARVDLSVIPGASGMLVDGPWTFISLLQNEHCNQDPTTLEPPSSPPPMSVIAFIACP